MEVGTHPTSLGTLMSKCDFGPVKLPCLSRNGPQVLNCAAILVKLPGSNFIQEVLLIKGVLTLKSKDEPNFAFIMYNVVIILESVDEI